MDRPTIGSPFTTTAAVHRAYRSGNAPVLRLPTSLLPDVVIAPAPNFPAVAAFQWAYQRGTGHDPVGLCLGRPLFGHKLCTRWSDISPTERTDRYLPFARFIPVWCIQDSNRTSD